MAAARKAKETLSRKNDIGLTYSDHEAGSGRLRVSRSEFNHAIMPLVDQTSVKVELYESQGDAPSGQRRKLWKPGF